METVELWKCDDEGCGRPCITDNRSAHQLFHVCKNVCWKPVTATIHPQPEPEEEEFEFGDRVEVYLCEKWMPGKFISDQSTVKWVLLDEDKTPHQINTSGQIRRPLRERMRKGQIVVILTNRGVVSAFRIYQKFHDDLMCTLHGAGYVDRDWRLPTRAELDEIGHSGKGWLTSDGGE